MLRRITAVGPEPAPTLDRWPYLDQRRRRRCVPRRGGDAPFLAETFGNPSGAHAAARAAKTALEEAREQVAGALGAEPGEIVFTGGGTEADNLAVKGAARAAALPGSATGS